MIYYIDGDLIRYVGENKSGYFHKDFQCVEMSEYESWVAEGNTAEQWNAEQPESEI